MAGHWLTFLSCLTVSLTEAVALLLGSSPCMFALLEVGGTLRACVPSYQRGIAHLATDTVLHLCCNSMQDWGYKMCSFRFIDHQTCTFAPQGSSLGGDSSCCLLQCGQYGLQLSVRPPAVMNSLNCSCHRSLDSWRPD